MWSEQGKNVTEWSDTAIDESTTYEDDSASSTEYEGEAKQETDHFTVTKATTSWS